MTGEHATDWREPEPVNLPADYLPDRHEVLRLILWQRGYRTNEHALLFLDPSRFRLPDEPFGSTLSRAVDRLLRARDHGERVAVWGDYDADGQTATAVLVGTLRQAGLEVLYRVPGCDEQSRGLNSPGLKELAQQGCRVVVTCDCGTNDVAPVAEAVALGLEMIITDHHAQTGPLPAALAVVNSSHLAVDDPLWGLPGVAVAYLIGRAVLRRLDRAAEANQWLDLVALGAIADVAPHTPALRALLARGLPRLWGRPRAGIQALLRRAGRRPLGLDTATISFLIGPVLNAAGRLGDPCEGVELLLADDAEVASRLAARLWALKNERNRLAVQLEQEIDAQLLGAEPLDTALVLAGRDWHPGVLGRVAGAVSRRYGRPAVIIGVPSDGTPARGSIRATSGYDLMAVLGAVDRDLLRYGGHPRAAGLRLEPQAIEAFRVAFLAALATQGATPDQGLAVDAVVTLEDLTQFAAGAPGLGDQLLQLAPFGEGNAEPVLSTQGLRVVERRRFGADGQHALLTLADEQGRRWTAKWWRHDPGWEPGGLIDVAYTMAHEEWQGRIALQYTLRGVRPHRGSSQDKR